MNYIDISTGEVVTVFLFVGTLPYSQYNWIEIERQYKYIQTLQKILSENDIPYPNEYDFWIIIQEGLELFQTLKLTPQVCPSNQPLKPNPQKLAF